MNEQLSEELSRLVNDQFVRAAKRSLANGANIFARLNEQTLNDVLATDEFDLRDMMAAGLLMSVLFSLELVQKANGGLPATLSIAMIFQVAELLKNMMGDRTTTEVLDTWAGPDLEDMAPEGTA